ncbi:MAG: polysaccharide biosynthesis/export family protein [Deltaproteobacteria bacterium]|nr:polysaccharide biosynthesis/export family protein [Deltaproteobacteria bacterium]
MKVVGKTPAGIARAVKQKYARVFRDPVVTVSVLEYGSVVENFKQAIWDPQRGPVLKVPIGPDGSVRLPYVGTVRAAGKTIGEFEEQVNASYGKLNSGIKTAIYISEVRGGRIFVFGAVRRPGMLSSEKPITLLQALAMAGGLKPGANANKIGILYWDSKYKPRIRVVSVKRIMEELKIEEDLILPPNSIIYVPLSPVAKLGFFLEQLKRLFLFTGTSLGFSYEIHSAGGGD